MDPERIGPYRIEGRLGAGGMGLVWAASDERLGRRVAIKCLTPDREASPEHRERLRREARALAAIHHPAVAEVYDVVEDGDALYVVMEHVEGDTLGARLLAGPLPPAEAARIGARIARALTAVHARRLVHRDLKADNVIVGPDGEVTVVDFGLVKRFDPDRSEASLTSDGVVMGTSRAMSPEQATGRDVDHRSDLFALGSLLYEMLTGRHPFQGSTPLETMERVARHRPPRVDRLAPDVRPELVRLVEQLLEKNPSRRPRRAADVAAILERSVPESGTGPSSSSEHADGRRRRRRAAAGVMAFVAVASLAAWWWWSRPPDLPRLVAVTAGAAPPGWRPLLDAAVLQIGSDDRDPRTAVDWCGGDDVGAVASAARADEVLRILPGDDGATRLERWRAVPVQRVATIALDGPPSPSAAATAVRALYPDATVEASRLPAPPVDDLVTLDRLRATADDAVFVDELQSAVGALSRLRTRRPRLVEAHLATASAAARLAAEWGVDGAAREAADAVATARRLAPDDPRVAAAAAEAALAAGDPDRVEDIIAAAGISGPGRQWWSARLAAGRGDVSRALELAGDAGPLPAPRALEAAGWELRTGRVAEAHTRLTALLPLAPRSRRVRATLVVVELVRGDTGRALDVAGGVDAIDGAVRALVALDLGRPDLALATLDDQTARERPPVGVLRCMALVALGRRDDAAREADAVLARWSSDGGVPPTAVDVVAAPLLAAAGRVPQARAAVQRLSAPATRDPVRLAVGAWASAVAGDPDAARDLAARAVESGLAPRWRRLLPAAASRDD